MGNKRIVIAAVSAASVASLLFVVLLRRRHLKRNDPGGVRKNDPVLLRWGMIADVQYADLPDAMNFKRTRTRFYRKTLEMLARAVAHWNHERGGVDFIAQLGDLIDGQSRGKLGEEGARAALASVVEIMDTSTCRDWHHAIGNHELYNFTREELRETLLRRHHRRRCRTHVDGSDFYSFSAGGNDAASALRFVVLDPYEITSIERDDLRGGLGSKGTGYRRALEILKDHNPNDVTAFGVDWEAGLDGLARRFVPYNGAVGEAQLDWLARTCRDARERKQRMVVFTHVPICPGACQDSTLLWNYEEVMHILHSDGYGVVVAVFAGHDHRGGYAIDAFGVHHVTMESPLESPNPDVPGGENDNRNAFATVSAFSNRLELTGHGAVKSRVLPFAADTRPANCHKK